MVAEIVSSYLEIFPDERPALQPLLSQLAAGEALNDRKNFRGHITGGAIILSPDKSQILVIHHKLFDKWLQPGGHWDASDATPWEVAWREAEEETGVSINCLLPVYADPTIPLDIGRHAIMARPERHEPAHDHYDLRYVFLAKTLAITPALREVHEARWVGLNDKDARGGKDDKGDKNTTPEAVDPLLAGIAPILTKLRASGALPDTQ